MLYFTIFLVVVPSPVLMFLSSEAIAIFIGLTSDRPWFGVACALAAGQTVGFSLLYFFGDRLLGSWPRLQAKVRNFDLSRIESKAPYFLCTGSLIGLPPHNLMCICAPAVGVRWAPLAAITFTGRTLRYCVFAGLPAYFADYFPVDWIPTWLSALV